MDAWMQTNARPLDRAKWNMLFKSGSKEQIISEILAYQNSDGGLGGGFAWNGEAFLVCSTTAYALSSVLMRVYGQKEDPITISGYQFLLGGIVLSGIGFAFGGRLVFYSVSCVLMLVYLGFVSTGAFTLWSILLKYNPVSKVSIYSVMTPIFGVTLSTLLLSESSQVSWLQCLGALALVSLGIWTINRPEK